jgi:AhpD family alkylhydroperoxidase
MERISNNELPQGFLLTLLKVQEYVDKSGLEYSLLELIRMRVSQLNGCAYCLDMHFKNGVHAGDTPQRLISVGVWREVSYYTKKEKAALEFAERLTKMNPDEDAHDIHDRLLLYFTKEEIAHLTLAIIQINSWNRFVRSFGTEAGTYQIKEKATA